MRNITNQVDHQISKTLSKNVVFRVQPINYSYQSKKQIKKFKSKNLQGYLKYLTREEALEQKKIQMKGLYNYVIHREGATGLFDMYGNDLTKNNLNQLNQEFKNVNGIVWHIVISFDTNFALQNHITDSPTAQALLKNHLVNMMTAHLGIEKDNLESFFAFHTNTDNPHIQGVIFEKEHHRRQPRLELKYINLLREDIEAEAKFYELTKSPHLALTQEQIAFEKRLNQFLIQEATLKAKQPEKEITEYYTIDKLMKHDVFIPALQLQRYDVYQKKYSSAPEILMKGLILNKFINSNHFQEHINQEANDPQTIKNYLDNLHNNKIYKNFEKNFLNQFHKDLYQNKDKYLLSDKEINKQSKQLTEKLTFQKPYQEKAFHRKMLYRFSHNFDQLWKNNSKTIALQQHYMLKKFEYERKVLSYENSLEIK